MKIIILTFMMCFIGSQASFAQNKSLCEQTQKKLGKDKMLQLYWTEKLGEYLLIHPGQAPYTRDSILFSKTQVKPLLYYKMYTSYGHFVMIVYNEEFEIACDDDGEISVRTRFSSRSDWSNTMNDSKPVREAYFILSKEKEFDPTQQELDALCKKFNH